MTPSPNLCWCWSACGLTSIIFEKGQFCWEKGMKGRREGKCLDFWLCVTRRAGSTGALFTGRKKKKRSCWPRHRRIDCSMNSIHLQRCSFNDVCWRTWPRAILRQSYDTLVALHCKPLPRLFPGSAASNSSKQSTRGRWTPFTYITARRTTSVVSWWNTDLFWIVNFLYYIRGPLRCIYWSLFVLTQRNDIHFYLGRRPTISSCTLGPWGSREGLLLDRWEHPHAAQPTILWPQPITC